MYLTMFLEKSDPILVSFYPDLCENYLPSR